MWKQPKLSTSRLNAHAFGVVTARGAETVFAAASRAVGLLIATCRQQRRTVDEIARAWRAWRGQVATPSAQPLQKAYFAEEHARSGAVDLFLPFNEA